MTDNKDSLTVHDHIHPREWIRRGFYVALGVALLYVLALAVREFGLAVLAIAAPFVVGLAVAVLIDPVIRRVQSRHIGRPMAVFLVFGAFLAIIVGGAYLTVPALIDQANQLSVQGPASIQDLRQTVNDYLTTHHHIGPIKLPSNFDTMSSKISDTASAALQKSAGNLTEVLLGSATIVIQLVVSLIVTFYILVDYDRLRARLFYLIPDRFRPSLRQYGADIGGVFAQYVRGLIFECILYCLCMIILLESMSVLHPHLSKSALLVGALAGVLYAVPYIGALTIGLLTFLVAFAAGGWQFALVALVLALAINQAFDYVVTPRIIGGGVGLHPVAALFALALGGELFHSIWGLILSVPLAGSVQVVLFRVFPKFSRPTPPEFLSTEGVRPGDKEAQKVPTGTVKQ